MRTQIIKTIAILMTIVVWVLSVGAERKEPHRECIDFEEQGFEEIKVTAYCCGTHTATGVPVHYGIMATSKEHLGDVALLYTMDGEYIGLFECIDQGGTDAIRQGYVVDVYHPTYEECKEFMRLTEGKCYIKYISGKG